MYSETANMLSSAECSTGSAAQERQRPSYLLYCSDSHCNGGQHPHEKTRILFSKGLEEGTRVPVLSFVKRSADKVELWVEVPVVYLSHIHISHLGYFGPWSHLEPSSTLPGGALQLQRSPGYFAALTSEHIVGACCQQYSQCSSRTGWQRFAQHFRAGLQ